MATSQQFIDSLDGSTYSFFGFSQRPGLVTYVSGVATPDISADTFTGAIVTNAYVNSGLTDTTLVQSGAGFAMTGYPAGRLDASSVGFVADPVYIQLTDTATNTWGRSPSFIINPSSASIPG